jgi:AcrR family transcriptional regulator
MACAAKPGKARSSRRAAMPRKAGPKTGRKTRPAEAIPGATRERLVDAARGLLEEGGYAAASVQAIADRVGVSAGALYRHFPSKAELFVEVFRDAAKRDLTAIDGAAAVGGCLERLEAAVAAHARGALQRRRLAWALLYEPVDPLVDAERLVYRRTYCRHMAGLLRQGIAAGEIPDQNVEMSAAAVVGAIAECLVGPLSPVAGQIAAQEDIVASLVRFCRRSVGAPDGASLRSVAGGRPTEG